MRKLIGNKAFYKMFFVVVIPLILQQGISSFVSLLDNVMVGRLGTEEMSGVAIVNQLLMVVYIGTYGILSGASIFSSQFFGAKDEEGIKHAFRYKVIMALIMLVLSSVVLMIFGPSLISSFIKQDSEVGNPALVYEHAMKYLKIMLFSLPFFMITQVYSSTVREGKETFLPMISSVVSLGVNLVLNYILIFGHLGFKPMGVQGAAIASIIARICEVLVLLIPIYYNKTKYYYFKGMFKTLRVPRDLSLKIFKKGLPLFLNEILWSMGMTKLLQIYSLRGLEVVASFNISSTISNLFSVFFQAIGSAVAIIMGQLLGKNEYEEAKKQNRWLFFLGISITLFFGAMLILVSPIIPEIYNVEETVKTLATSLLIVSGATMVIQAYNMICYFTLRSGGITYITFLFDSLFVIIVDIPLAIVLVKYSSLNISMVFLCVQLVEIGKAIIGTVLVSKNIWLKNIIMNKKADS